MTLSAVFLSLMDQQESNDPFSSATEDAFIGELYENNLEALEKLQDQRIEITKYLSDLAKLKLLIDKDPLAAANRCLSLKTSAPTSIDSITKVPPDPSIYYSNINFQNYNTRKVTTKVLNEPLSKSPVTLNKSSSNDVPVNQDVDDTKPANFNKPWAEEEQLLFEHLLNVYPLEKSEMARCRKIADAMGTRTPRQVRSRLQKYFNKLKVFNKYQKSTAVNKDIKTVTKYTVNRNHKMSTKVFRKTTFLPRYNVSEQISNKDDKSTLSSRNEIVIKQEDLDPDMKSEILLQLESFRFQDSIELSAEHVGYKCIACEQDPIVGPRWHCILCIQRTDLCCSCMREYVETPLLLVSDQHQVFHPFEVIITPSIGTFNDPDYLLDKFDSNNYLDPNFLPE